MKRMRQVIVMNDFINDYKLGNLFLEFIPNFVSKILSEFFTICLVNFIGDWFFMAYFYCEPWIVIFNLRKKLILSIQGYLQILNFFTFSWKELNIQNYTQVKRKKLREIIFRPLVFYFSKLLSYNRYILSYKTL